MRRTLAITLTLAGLMGMMTFSAGAAYLSDPNHLTADDAGNTSTAGTKANEGDTTDTAIGSKDIAIKLKTESGGGDVHVYAVSFSATELTFTWNNTATTIWNPETLEYETSSAEGGWANASQKITVKNYSDVAIKVTADNTAPTSSDTGVTVAVDGPLELASAYDGTATGTVKEGDITVTVNGTPDKAYLTATEVARFTLNVTRNEA